LSYILLGIIIIFFLTLGALVIRNNFYNKVNRNFSALVLITSLWMVFNFLENEIKDINLASFILKLDFAFAAIIVYFFIKFCFYFSRIEFNKNKLLEFIFLIPTVIIFIISFTSLILQKIYFNIDNTINYEIGPLYFLYGVYLFTYFILSFGLLIKRYGKAYGLEKMQLMYVILGLFISGLFAAVINVIVSRFITDINILRLGIYGMVFFVGFTAYAILRYRLMDIRVIIRRSAVFTSLVLLITALYAVLAYFLSLIFTDIFGVSSLILNGIVMAILVALGFEPLKQWLSEVTDSFLFKAEYKPQEVLSEFSDRLSSTLDLGTLTQFITQKSLEVFKCARVSLFLLDKKDSLYKQAAVAGKESQYKIDRIDKALFARVFNYLHSQNQEKDIIVREEIRKNNEQLKNKVLDTLLAELDKYEVNLIVPVYSKDELIGIIFLGDKKSGDVYSDEDIRILEIIAAQSAVAMQNAQLFEEQKHFAAQLKIEVDKATKELKIANIQLRKLDRAKSEFISIASHQLRTPLTVIKGYLSMIDQKDFGQVPAKLANPLDRVYKSTLRIIGLVEDLLNVSRIESGRMKFDFEMVDVNDLVKEVFDELEQHAKNKGLTFSYLKPTKNIPAVKLDRNKVREVIMNLMDNAIKYTEHGSVIVGLEKLDDHVRFSVKDTGRGIAPDEMPLLFQKFSRAKGVQLVHTEGTGLGLYIAKKILQKHHAKIWAESAGAGKGSAFIIEFKV